MQHSSRARFMAVIAGLLAAELTGGADTRPAIVAPHPYYETIFNWASFPDGRPWGTSAGIDIDRNGVNVWALERCGGTVCTDSKLDPIVEIDSNGRVIKTFGGGLFVHPHGIYVDRDDNIWVTDGMSNVEHTKGLQVFKFTHDGKLLLTLGTAGRQGEDATHFGSPTDVVTAANGDIFVSDGHAGCRCANARIVKFSREGKFIKAFGELGDGHGAELFAPHSLAMDSQGRVFVADRSNNRIVIFTQDGDSIAQWRQFGRPSGLYIDDNDVLYVSDSESSYGHNDGVERGIHIGSARSGEVFGFVPDPARTPDPIPLQLSSGPEGIAADAAGNLYGVGVSPTGVTKYRRKP
jgi:DNA-binding beta-propeller fold protein YncE